MSQGKLIADLLKSLQVHHLISVIHSGLVVAGGWGWDVEALKPLKPTGWGRLHLGWAVRTGTRVNGINIKYLVMTRRLRKWKEV